MASGPSEPPRRPPGDDEPRPEGASEPHHETRHEDTADPRIPHEPRIRHRPPGPTDDRARGLPVTSPWGMPPFTAPIPEEEQPEAPKGRRPYSSPTAEPETKPKPNPEAGPDAGPGTRPETGSEAGSEAGTLRRPRRIVNRPDKLVASGPPRPHPTPERSATPPEPEPHTTDRPAPDPGAPGSASDEPGATPWRLSGEDVQSPREAVSAEETSAEEESAEEAGGGEDEPVRRVGRPPGGRPTRPDLLVASGPARPTGALGRHHRGPAPAALRRSSPMRRGSRAVPVTLSVVLALLLVAGVLAWRWTASDGPGLRLAAGTGRSGDELFTVPASGDGTEQKLNDMASAGRAVVAVGSDTTSPTPRPLFLFSPDGGRTWQLGQVTGTTTPTVQRVVGGGGRWLASGGDAMGVEHGLWTSADGFSWAAVDQAGLAAFRTGDVVADIARTASGFVAVGRSAGEDGRAVPAAWRSSDGRSWERVETRDLGVGEISAVVAKGDTVVAVGRPVQGDGARVLRSSNGGGHWQATDFRLPGAIPRPGTLAVLPKRFVLVPARQRTISGDVPVYCSPTGAQWSACGSIGGLGAESPGVETLVSYPSGVAAVSQAGLGTYTVLASSDGRSWSRRADLGGLTGATLRGFTVSESGTLFAAGDQAASDVDNQAVLLSAPPRGAAARVPLDKVEGLARIARETTRLVAFDGRYVAVGSASGDAGLWTVEDWRSWKAMSLGGAGRQTLEDVTHGGRGWLAVGGTESGTAVTDPLLVSSADGENWRRVAATGDLARERDHPYLDVRVAVAGKAGGKEGYVLAGEDRDRSGAARAAVWFTPDLREFTRSKKLPQGGSGVRVHDAIAFGDGYLAVGGAGTGDRESTVVWFSEDGVNWAARPRLAPEDATSAGLRRIVSYQGKLVAIGTAVAGGARRPFAAVSDDGARTWRTAWLPADRAAAVYDLAAAGQGLVAVGWHGEQGDGDSAAWTSQDGLSWSRMALTGDRLAGPGMQWLSAVAVSGSEVVALGRSTTYDSDHMILWTSSLSAGR